MNGESQGRKRCTTMISHRTLSMKEMEYRIVVLDTSYDMTLFMWFRPFRDVFRANILGFD
jgi:hypothetical protein